MRARRPELDFLIYYLSGFITRRRAKNCIANAHRTTAPTRYLLYRDTLIKTELVSSSCCAEICTVARRDSTCHINQRWPRAARLKDCRVEAIFAKKSKIVFFLSLSKFCKRAGALQRRCDVASATVLDALTFRGGKKRLGLRLNASLDFSLFDIKAERLF